MPRPPSVLPALYERIIRSAYHPELYADENVRLSCKAQQAYLLFCSSASAGAIGKAQGEAFSKALLLLETEDFRALTLFVNSAGAHFGEPMEGLLALNRLLENLWGLRARRVYIRVVCDGWLYGGMGMLVAAVAHEVLLTPEASWGLLGSRVTGQEILVPTPLQSFQPCHLKLKRMPIEQMAVYLRAGN